MWPKDWRRSDSAPGLGPNRPALLRKTSIVSPSNSRASSEIAPKSDTSSRNACTLPRSASASNSPASAAVRYVVSTRQPSAAYCFANSSPKPRLAPVIITVEVMAIACFEKIVSGGSCAAIADFTASRRCRRAVPPVSQDGNAGASPGEKLAGPATVARRESQAKALHAQYRGSLMIE